MPSVDYDTLPKILILATEACAYPGADYVGQIHAEYFTNTYIVRVPAPVILPEDFYLRCFEKGIAGILVMSCGHECPYPGAYDALAARISRVHQQMAERGVRPERLRLCAICSVCSRAFLNEVNQMQDKVLRANAETEKRNPMATME
ncbi:MAG: hydrogenase iron-sulfur subunit [Thermoguttaceae bacterium]|jgi:coenzyme F420-reducing hydrogenase delta subunit|nr:hydrogenase iron-sulfur subunit [Thermoguttaceae bacterium]